MQLENILKAPLITEKTAVATEKYNRFGFTVELKASKNQIKEAVEKLYDVKVEKVNTNITPGKLKRAGRNIAKSPKVKKAWVQLAEGQKIEFFKGV
ncbi:MAG: 50S ribosomal protein L23 [Bacteriovoracaceae bacterium]|nr:50S ribosomal protein L23 [Bacteriovoracaceae bacterium]